MDDQLSLRSSNRCELSGKTSAVEVYSVEPASYPNNEVVIEKMLANQLRGIEPFVAEGQLIVILTKYLRKQ